MSTRGYGAYRGRSPLKRILKILLIVALVLAALLIVATVYLQQYLVISNDGVRLDLPYFQETSTPETPTPSVVVTPGPPVVIVTPEPTPTPEPISAALFPVVLSQEDLLSGAALSQMEAAGGDCILLDMKTDSGKLGYVSAIELAKYTRQTAEDPALNDAVAALNQTKGLYTVARVSCFKDDDITDWERSLAIFTNSGYRWTDPENIHWISPTNPDVRDYLTEICVELAQLGFDEILLDNAGYPNRGNLHYIKKGEAYDAAQFSTVIDGFYAQVAAALAEYDVKLSVVTTPEALADEDTLTGQTAATPARFDRLWKVDETGSLAPFDFTPVFS